MNPLAGNLVEIKLSARCFYDEEEAAGIRVCVPSVERDSEMKVERPP